VPVKKSISIDSCIDTVIRKIMSRLIEDGYNPRYSNVANMLMYIGALYIKDMDIEKLYNTVIKGIECKELGVR